MRSYTTDDGSRTNPEKSQVIGHVPPVDAFEAVAAAVKPVRPKDTMDTKTANSTIDSQVLKVATLDDANRIQMTLGIDLDKVGVKDARIIMSEEQIGRAHV